MRMTYNQRPASVRYRKTRSQTGKHRAHKGLGSIPSQQYDYLAHVFGCAQLERVAGSVRSPTISNKGNATHREGLGTVPSTAVSDRKVSVTLLRNTVTHRGRSWHLYLQPRSRTAATLSPRRAHPPRLRQTGGRARTLQSRLGELWHCTARLSG